MPRIFISYRRSDSISITGRIYDRLVAAFGRANVFMDVDNIDGGVDFRTELNRAASRCDVMLVIIGQQWLNTTDKHGNRRLDDSGDFVRIEVETGLGQPEITVIPLTVSGAEMPAEANLPASLAQLAYQNARPVRENPDFHGDMLRLIKQIREAPTRKQKVAKPPRFSRRQRRMIAALAILLPLLALLVYGINSVVNPDRGINRFTQFTMPPIAPRASKLIAMSSASTYMTYLVDSTSGDRVLELENAIDPSWSPDGARLTYTTGDGRLYILNPYTGEGRRISEVGEYFYPVWSPDGDWIAAAVGRAGGGNWDVVITATDIESGNFPPPRTSIGEDALPFLTWSADGEQLAFPYMPEGASSADAHIRVVNIEDSSIIDLPAEYALSDWSARGMLVSVEENNCHSVGHYDIERARYMEIVADVCFPWVSAQWSPDGSSIAISRGDTLAEGDMTRSIGIVNLQTGETRWLEGLPPRSAILDWSPDSQSIVYESYTENAADPDGPPTSAVNIVNVSNGNTRVLHTNAYNELFSYAAWQP